MHENDDSILNSLIISAVMRRPEPEEKMKNKMFKKIIKISRILFFQNLFILHIFKKSRPAQTLNRKLFHFRVDKYPAFRVAFQSQWLCPLTCPET